jgi:Protein of unknown function (DUF1761)
MEPHINWLAMLVATLLPMIIGFVYFHPKVLGGVWMRANGFTLESIGAGPKPILYLLCLFLSFLLAFWQRVQFFDPHQTSIDFEGNPHNYATFGHGAVHGIGYGLLLVLPILGTLAVFEKRPLSWVLTNWGYWMLTLIAMSAVLSGWR